MEKHPCMVPTHHLVDFTSTLLQSPTRWRHEAAVYHVIINCDIIRILEHQLFYLTFILIGFIIAPRFQPLLLSNIQRNQQLFRDIGMQIKSFTNQVLTRVQLIRIWHGLSGLNNSSSSMITSRFWALQKLHRMISRISIQLALIQ